MPGLMYPVAEFPVSIGAGEGNRTLVISLEGFCSTIELHPRRDSYRQTVIKSQIRSQKYRAFAQVGPLSKSRRGGTHHETPLIARLRPNGLRRAPHGSGLRPDP